MSLALVRSAITRTDSIVNFKIRLPWLVHIALVLVASPILIWATRDTSTYDMGYVALAAILSFLMPMAKPFFDHTDLNDNYPERVSYKTVWLYQPVYRLWHLLVQVAFTTWAYLGAWNIIF